MFPDRPHRGRRYHSLLLTLLAAGTLPACTPASQDFGFEIDRLESRTGSEGTVLVIHQRVSLSTEAREALVNGVPLVILVEVRLRPPGARNETVRAQRRFEIRYLPLSDHFQLTAGEDLPVRTYPRLRHALSELAQVAVDIPAGAAGGGLWAARARSFLAASELPPPMRLPAWFSARWRHDSGWHAQAVSMPERG